MSPRTPASREDATALRFLDVAARLIDAYLSDDQADPPARLRAIRFPAAFDWLRIEDVLRLAAASSDSGVSRKAFFNRWETKEEFLRDAIVHAVTKQGRRGLDASSPGPFLPTEAEADGSLAISLRKAADDLLEGLHGIPSSFLITHVAPLLHQHPKLRDEIVAVTHANLERWAAGYAQMMDALGVTLRPGWTPLRLQMTLQAMLDGFLVRARLEHDHQAAAGLFGEAVVALLVGTIDADRTSLEALHILDRVLSGTGRVQD